MRHISSLAAALLCASAMVSPAAAVTSTTVTAGVALASLGTATAVVGTGGAVLVDSTTWYNSLFGVLIAAGGIAIGAVDPPAGTFFNGRFTLQYPSDLIQVTNSGWLGDWGVNASLQPPPADPLTWPSGLPIVLQNPAAGLTASIDNSVSGSQTISFDWGPSGHPVDGPLNVFASVFEAKTDIILTFLGTAAAPPAGATFLCRVRNFNVLCRRFHQRWAVVEKL
jgi:hypothetical protein